MDMSAKRSVTLTEDQWNTITRYILMTTNYRKGEREAWLKLMQERRADGSIKFPNAESNARFWEDMEKDLDLIRRKIDKI